MDKVSLTFSVNVEWTGSGRSGEGAVQAGAQRIDYSAPASMGGKGSGTSPEELLLAAVTSCYSATLYRVLERSGLPVSRVFVATSGYVEDYPQAARFARIVVHPTIAGADASRLQEYRQEALRARELCFIGKTVQGNVAYEVGEVRTRE
jgi:peroxiredoxin-like protein